MGDWAKWDVEKQIFDQDSPLSFSLFRFLCSPFYQVLNL